MTGDDVVELTALTTALRERFPAHGYIAIESGGTERVLRLVGEIDLAVVQAFEAGSTAHPTTVDAIDAGEVTYISAAGAALMLRWRLQSEAGGRRAMLRRSSRPVEHLMGHIGVDFGSGCAERMQGVGDA